LRRIFCAGNKNVLYVNQVEADAEQPFPTSTLVCLEIRILKLFKLLKEQNKFNKFTGQEGLLSRPLLKK
jgi:hypothetical protein